MSQATHYEIQKSLNNSTWHTIAFVPFGTKSYVDRNVPNGITAYYRIRAAILTIPYSGYPLQPGLPKYSAYASANAVSVIPATNYETHFVVEKSMDNITWNIVAYVASGINTCTVENVPSDVIQYFRIRGARLAYPYSGYPAQSGAPSYSAYTSTTNKTCSFDGAETGFKIERNLKFGGTWEQIATVGVNVTTHTDTPTTPGLPISLNPVYSYRVRSYNGSGNSGYSNIVDRDVCGGVEILPDMSIATGGFGSTASASGKNTKSLP